MRQTRNILIAILLLILGGSVGYRYGQTGKLPLSFKQANGQIIKSENPTSHKDASLDTFWEVYDELQKDYLRPDKINAENMVNGAISGMTSALGDPYTTYLPPEDDKRVAQEIAGHFSGVGIELGYRDNILAVVAPLKGTPAEIAGVQAGDLILHISDKNKNIDEDTNGWSLNEAVEIIRGPQGSEITLTLLRKDQTQSFEVTLKRQDIVVDQVSLQFVEHNGKKVAHLKLMRFGEQTRPQWETAVSRILAEPNVQGIVLDMRNNPGGLFEESISIASDFVENGTVVQQKGKYSTQEFTAQGQARLGRFKVAVLVNKGSASAAEIVAGALRDNLDTKLYGETTFGKGTVQDRRNLGNGGGLHVTIAEWLLPKGESIHDKGIPATVEIKDDVNTPDDEVLFKAIEEL